MRTFWNPTPNELVCIFITAAFTGVVWVAVVYFGAFHNFIEITFFHGVHVEKFHSIVTGDGFKGFPKDRSGQFPFKAVKDF